MSIFEGLPEHRSQTYEAYQPGSLGYDPQLVERLRDWFPGISNLNFKSPKYTVLDELAYLAHELGPGNFPALKPNAFLDALMALVIPEADNHHLRTFYCLTDPILQTLYDVGYNNFVLNIGKPDRSPWIGWELMGTERRPLTLKITGDVDTLGSLSQHCDFEVIGDIQSTGFKAKHCTFRLRGLVEELDLKARNSEVIDCTYYIESPEPLEQLCNTIYPKWKLPQGCAFYVGSEIRQKTLSRFKNKLFFKYKNGLYIPDGNEGWLRVDPVEEQSRWQRFTGRWDFTYTPEEVKP